MFNWTTTKMLPNRLPFNARGRRSTPNFDRSLRL